MKKYLLLVLFLLCGILFSTQVFALVRANMDTLTGGCSTCLDSRRSDGVGSTGN
jgi:hypothetical protein